MSFSVKIQIIYFFQFGQLYEMEILVDIEYDEVKFRNVTEFSSEQLIWRFSEGFSLEIAKKIATTDHSLVHSFFKMDTTYDRTKFAISSFLRLTQHHNVLFDSEINHIIFVDL